MKPTRQDVQEMTSALFMVTNSLERARRQIPAAHALTILYDVAAREQRVSGRHWQQKRQEPKPTHD